MQPIDSKLYQSKREILHYYEKPEGNLNNEIMPSPSIYDIKTI